MKIVHFEMLINNLKRGEIHLIENSGQVRIMSNVDLNLFAGKQTNNLFNKTKVSGSVKENIEYDCMKNIIQYCDQDEKNNNDNNFKIESDFCSTSFAMNCNCKEIFNSNESIIKILIPHSILIQFYNKLLKLPKLPKYNLNQFFNNLKFKRFEGNEYSLINLNILILGYNVIDYKWNKQLEETIHQRKELDRTMSWLSTLGGAYSSLGDENEQFANKAARTSVEQYRLALRIGDESIIAKCKLFYALSLIQRGYYSQAYIIIKQQYKIANSGTIKDKKLKNMCLGIFSKLKSEYRRCLINK